MKFDNSVALIVTVIHLVLCKESTIKILNLEKCPLALELNRNVNWSISQNNNESILSLTAQTQETWDMNNLTCEISVFQRKPEENYKKLLTVDGGLCEYVTLLLGETWDNARFSIEPQIKEPCLIEVGKYKLTNYVLNPKKTLLPSLLPQGQLKLELTALQNENVLNCITVELVSE